MRTVFHPDAASFLAAAGAFLAEREALHQLPLAVARNCVEDPARYPQSSVLRDAAQLRRPLLLMHGTADDNVVVGHTLALSKELLAAGRDFEVLLFPGQTHMIADPTMRKQVWMRALRFFRRTLAAS